jgi:hypothetical protein
MWLVSFLQVQYRKILLSSVTSVPSSVTPLSYQRHLQLPPLLYTSRKSSPHLCFFKTQMVAEHRQGLVACIFVQYPIMVLVPHQYIPSFLLLTALPCIHLYQTLRKFPIFTSGLGGILKMPTYPSLQYSHLRTCLGPHSASLLSH